MAPGTLLKRSFYVEPVTVDNNLFSFLKYTPDRQSGIESMYFVRGGKNFFEAVAEGVSVSSDEEKIQQLVARTINIYG